VFFTIQTPTYNEGLFEQAKQQLDAFLGKVVFHRLTSKQEQQKTISLLNPAVSFSVFPNFERPFSR
jgi:hypothetical protein